jgi:hypothetical protein
MVTGSAGIKRPVQLALVILIATEKAHPYESDPRLVADILWLFSYPGDGLEHIRVNCDSRKIYLAFFYCAETTEIAQNRAIQLCRRAVINSPHLTGWHRLESTDGTVETEW